MSSAATPRPRRARPNYDLNLAHLPPPGLVSIFHRISGILLFFPILPLLLWFLQTGLGSEAGYLKLKGWYAEPMVKLIVIAVVWAYCHHFWAGLRYLAMDVHWKIMRDPARKTAYAVFVLGALSALVIGWRIW